MTTEAKNASSEDERDYDDAAKMPSPTRHEVDAEAPSIKAGADDGWMNDEETGEDE